MFVKLSEQYTQNRAFQYINLPLIHSEKCGRKPVETAPSVPAGVLVPMVCFRRLRFGEALLTS